VGIRALPNEIAPSCPVANANRNAASFDRNHELPENGFPVGA
jgi:hypothetical protein